MIQVEYSSNKSNPNKSAIRNLGFRLLICRHKKQLNLSKLSKKIGFPAREIDDVELGKSYARLDVVLAMCQYFKQEVDFNLLKSIYQLDQPE